MNIKMVLIGMAAGLLLPLAAANAGAVFDPSLRQTGASTDLGRGAAPTAENFWFPLGGGDDGKGDNDHKCDKSPSKDHDCDKDDHHHRKCDKKDEDNHHMKHDKDGEWEDHEGKCDRDDQRH